MLDMQTMMGLANSLKLAGDITKAMLDIRDGAMLQAKVIELQSIILGAQGSALAAQNDQFSLLETIRNLEARLAGLEAWQAERNRYALTDYGGGTFAYELKPEECRGEPIHRLCPSCFNNGTKSVLQFLGKFGGGSQDGYRCVPCKYDYFFGVVRPASSRSGGSGGPNSWLAG